jgi:hypothetical protein
VEFKTRCRGLLASMAATVIGLLSRLPDFNGFGGSSSSSSTAAAVAGSSYPNLQVVGGCGSPIGAPGIRNRGAAALAAAIRHLQGGDRELLEQAAYTALLLMCPGILETAMGGTGRQGGKDDGAIIDEPAAATAFVLAYDALTSSSSGKGGRLDGSGFVRAFCESEARVLAEAAATAAAAGSSALESAAGQRPGPGSWDVDWRWQRRTSPMAVFDRLRRMLLWRCAQAEGHGGPAEAVAAGAVVSPAEAASGSVRTPVGCLRLSQLPSELVGLFCELVALSMAPNAGVRAVALPSLQGCMQRFPCFVELLLPEALAGLAGVPGLLLPGSSSPAAGGQPALLPDVAAVNRFYSETLPEAMQKQQADAAAAAEGAKGATAASAALAAVAAAAAAAAAAQGGDSQAAAAAAGAAAAAAAAAGAGGGSSSIAQESANDGRVAGACAVLAGQLEVWRVVFRDPAVFRAFLAALMASRTHSSVQCLKSVQGIIMQVWLHTGLSAGA